MKILHTSDWHLGRSLYGRKRYDEFSRFLEWLIQTVENEKVDILLIAGDVFDTGTPGNLAQELYYSFLYRVSVSCCRHVVVIAGNHDSPSFLNAPKGLLKSLNVHVRGSITKSPGDEIIELFDFKNGVLDTEQSAIICAVPYLRDNDVRFMEPGETIDDKNRKLVTGIRKHYFEVVKKAEEKREQILQQSEIKNPQIKIPIIAMGHLFTAGGKTVDGDGVRDLYVGSLAHVDKDSFPLSIDYFALGHLHVSQVVGGAEHIRYSGSPIPMGYGEINQKKKVVLVNFINNELNIQEIIVPCFQQLVRIDGSFDDISSRVAQLKNEGSSAWLEIEYTGKDIIADLREQIDEIISDSLMEIRRIKDRRVMERVLFAVSENEILEDLDVGDVFRRCLDAFEVPDQDREELVASYNEIVRFLHEEDIKAQ